MSHLTEKQADKTFFNFFRRLNPKMPAKKALAAAKALYAKMITRRAATAKATN